MGQQIDVPFDYLGWVNNQIYNLNSFNCIIVYLKFLRLVR